MANKQINKQAKIVGISCGIQGDDITLRRFYGEKLGALGLGAAALPCQSLAGEQTAEILVERLAEKLDGLLLSGGGDIHPRFWGEKPYSRAYQADELRDEWELALCRGFLAAGRPVLGICRGMQVINVALGGDLWQDLGAGSYHQQQGQPEELGHLVRLTGWLGEIMSAGDSNNENIFVNSLHHQGVRCLGRGLAAGAYALDGLVEAVYLPERQRWALGVQWHPERLGDAASWSIWREFARAVRG